MDIKGKKVSFTPSEARWAQDASMRFRAMPDVAQRILDARIEFVRPWLASFEVPPISIAIKNVLARIALNSSLDTLHETTKQHATDEEGREEHVIAIVMDRNEKERLLKLAQIGHEVAWEQLESPELIEVENKAIIDDFAMFAATSNYMEPDQAVALGDLLRDPEFNADNKARQHTEAEGEVYITTAIISALETDLSKSQQQEH